jgi:hypothetical protein
MRVYKLSILMLFLSSVLNLKAQKPIFGQVMGERVPQVCGSTGTSTADSTRLPILFQARVLGLTPGASYKYYTRFIELNDTGSSTSTGAGLPLSIKKGNWRTISSPDLNTAGGHDTFSLPIGFGDYLGWFGGIYTSDARFTPGKYVYPMIVLIEIGSGAAQPMKLIVQDSIKVLGFGTSFNADQGTAIYGKSYTAAKSIVSLYETNSGLSRPITVTYAESEGVNASNTQTWYSNNVNSKTGFWGTVIPNDLSSGVVRIESRDPIADTMIFSNVETDATWGNDSTINQKKGADPIFINSDYAPLVKPQFDFVVNTTNITEADTVLNLIVRRRYGNADSSKVSASVVAGTATAGTDYDILTTFPKVFKPYGDVNDTIKVRIYDDFVSETNENAAIRLNSPVNGYIGFQTTNSVVITDNDFPKVNFAKSFVKVAENDGILKVKLKITSGSTTPTNVRVVVKSKTDSTFIPQDFRMGNSYKDTIVQFPGGNPIDSIEFNIYLVNDNRGEDRSDTVVLALRTPTSPASVGSDSLMTLVITDDDVASLFKFNQTKLTVKETDASFKIRIDKIQGNIFQSDIILTSLNDSKYAQAGQDFTFSPQLLSFTPSDPDSLVLTIPLINDNNSEPKEDAVFVIRNSFNARIGRPDTFRVTILDDDLVEYKISKINTFKAANFTLDSLNVHCALRGVVYGVNLGPVGSPAGVNFTLRDETGGIRVISNTTSKGYTVAEGDSILVEGRITQVNGLAAISNLDTIIKITNNRAIKTPTVVTLLNETTESDLVKYNLVKLKNPNAWPKSPLAANTSVSLVVLTANDSFTMVIDSETDIDGKAAPSTFFNVVGLGSQNDPSSPYNGNYTLMPRKMADFTNLTVPVFSFTTDSSRAVENRDSSEGFVLQCANITTPIQITLAIAPTSTALRGTDYQSNATRLFILSPSKPSEIIKVKLIDDGLSEDEEYIIWEIKDNPWGTVLGHDSIHVIKLIDDETVGINAIQFASQFKVYPNPSSEIVNIESQGSIIESVEVIDANGRIVKTLNGIQNTSTSINLEELNKGIYKLRINTNEGIAVKVISVL